jgi:hypothetical protein
VLQREVTHFLWAEGLPGAEVNQRLKGQYGNSALLRRRANFGMVTSNVTGQKSPKFSRQLEKWF